MVICGQESKSLRPRNSSGGMANSGRYSPGSLLPESVD